MGMRDENMEKGNENRERRGENPEKRDGNAKKSDGNAKGRDGGKMEELAVNAIRILAADSVEKASSGHPGLPLGAAPMAYELWAHHMNHNPADPSWKNRDRFILSAGHGSSMLYALLHLFGYGGLGVEDLKNFRQLDSKTPGHPEYGHTAGVEATTGPLGAGLGTAVGMAMAEAHMAARFNREGFFIFDHYTYALCGDGCLMEGISSEVMSLAGTLKLGKLIVLYDSNSVTIEGSTDLAFTEDVEKRFEAFGFQVLNVADGTDIRAIGEAIELAKEEKERPSLIRITTAIGYGVPEKQGKSSAHGEPLGRENVKALRENLGWPLEEAFAVPEEVYEHYGELARKKAAAQEEWDRMFLDYAAAYPELKRLLDSFYDGENGKALLEDEAYWEIHAVDDATRNLSGGILNRLKDRLPNLMGGSADLGPSNKTVMKGEKDFGPHSYEGRNIHFGVREMGMTAILNGLALYGGLRPYGATFFVFADYMKPMLRLSALMGLPVTAVLTHDSIGVGEDGPTHQPVEQLTMLRSTPGIRVFRPADEGETLAAWALAVLSESAPTALVLSRQKLPALEGTGKNALKGGYILKKENKEKPDMILMASGSEVHLAVDAAAVLARGGVSARVVSMPCMELFEEQTDRYRESVLPDSVRKRLAVEAGSRMSWERYTGLDGACITMDTFGASAPAGRLFEKFGITVDHIVNTALELLR